MESLKKYLQINSGFSVLSGTVMVLFSQGLAALFGLDAGLIFLVIGVGLLFFGGSVLYVSLNQLENKKLVQLITILDVFWVSGSLAIVVFQLFDLSSTGYILIAVVMVIIGFFAINQYRHNQY